MELAFERGPFRVRRRPLADALELGAWRGAWTIMLGSLPAAVAYWLRYGGLDLPWGPLGMELGTFVAVTGALYGAGIALGDVLARESELGALRAPARLVFPALGGALAGLFPGAFAAEHFGRIDAPYFGTLEILIVGALSFFLYGAARFHAEDVPARDAMRSLGIALAAPFVMALGVWLVAPSSGWLVDALVIRVADSAPSLALFGALFAAGVGALFGGLLGFARALLAHASS